MTEEKKPEVGLKLSASWPVLIAIMFGWLCTCSFTCDRNLTVGPYQVGCAP